MYPVTARFRTAITQPHRLATLVEVLQDGVPIGDPIPSTIDATVTFDANAQTRSRLDITLADDGTLGLIPTTASDRLAPYGNEIRVWRGLTYPDGTTELVPLGVFRLDDNDIDDTDTGLPLKLAAPDRSARIIDARFEEPGQVDQGENVATAIAQLITPAHPDVVMRFATTSLVTPAIFYEAQGDRWQLAQDIATAAAMRLYYDRLGELVLAPDATAEPVLTIGEGETGSLVSVGKNWTRRGAYNRAIVTGENTGEGAPVRGVATDEDPLSPTRYDGPFGPAPVFMSSQLVTTTEQATDAAAALLRRQSGTTQRIRLGSFVLPHLDPGDAIRVTRGRLGLAEDIHVLDSLTIPLSPDGIMASTTRAVQVAA